MADRYAVTFPTLFIVPAWIQRHCVIPDGFSKGTKFKLYDWQLWCTLNHYRVKPDAEVYDENGVPTRGAAFFYRRSQVIAPQKALALDTPIATPSGWTTMGEVAVGDYVFDERGEPTRVLSKSPVWQSPTYRVTFSDGASLVACGDHQWWVERRNRSGKYLPERVTTRRLLDGLVDKEGARIYRVPLARPLRLPEVALPVDPYVLGAWLGDGNSDDARITGLDEGVFERIEMAGHEVRRTSVEKRRQVMNLKTPLRKLGVLRNKHIPRAYLRASEKQRWALLQGLMDTDGHVDARQGACEFTTTLPALRDGVRELLDSLGIRSACFAGEAKLNGRVTGPKWRISFRARRDMEVFGLSRKQERLKPPGRGHAQFAHRRIVAVEPVPMVPTQCLTVDTPSHVFLAGREMIPTCNTGKGPWSAAIICAEAVGPVLFAGWADGGEIYKCEEHDCGCGWEYTYRPGEPMGMRWPTPLIQLLATSEDQVDNVYRPLQAMAKGERLKDRMLVREGFIRLPDEGIIEVVTSSAMSRLGNPLIFCLQDESQLYTVSNKLVKVAETMRRGAAGMGGRSMETTNCFDPSEDSTAQRTFEGRAKDVFKFYEPPPPDLSFKNKAERRKIIRFNYAGSPHASVPMIEAECAELAEKDPAQAERYFGNRIVYGHGSYIDGDAWDARKVERDAPPRRSAIVLGFDGSDIDDWTGIRAETVDGYQFTPTFGPDKQPTVWNPADYGGQVPRLEVAAAVDELMKYYQVVRMYADPPYWETEIDAWVEKYGKEKVLRWSTFRPVQMHAAAERLLTDVTKAKTTFTHDGCSTTATHVRNTRKAPRPNGRYVLAKASPTQKIDLTVCSVLVHEAAGDAVAAGIFVAKRPNYMFTG